MVLTVDRKKRFLITMLIIMGCATMINFGLYNVLNTYFKNSDTAGASAYSTVQLNIIIVLTVIASVTVIMVILIPKDNINEMMAKIQQQDGAQTIGGGGNLGLDGSGNNSTKPLTDEEQLQSMIDEDLEQDKNNKK